MHKIFIFLAAIIVPTGLKAQCNNVDFEASALGSYTAANAINGWTISSQSTSNCAASSWNAGSPEFSIVNTPLLSLPGVNIGNSPFGGNKIAMLNNYNANGLATKISQTFTISSNQNYGFAFAGIIEDGNHPCCQQAGISVRVLDASGNSISCYEYKLAGTSTLCTNTSYTSTGILLYKTWETRYLDLAGIQSPFITIEVTARDCEQGNHFATIFFDATCNNLGSSGCLYSTNPSFLPTTYCQGSSVAHISGVGFNTTSFKWLAPSSYSTNPILNNTLSVITITNPVPGTTFSLVLQSMAGCTYTFTTLLVPSTPTIMYKSSCNSCVTGSNGCASGGVSGPGPYLFKWYNSSGAVIGTFTNSSTTGINCFPEATPFSMDSLPPGLYSVTVSGPDSSSCIISDTIRVNSYTKKSQQQTVPFCGNLANLIAPVGSKYQWYSGTSTVSALNGATSQTLAVANPKSLIQHHVTYISPDGCQDSIKYYLAQVNTGKCSISTSLTCKNLATGIAVIQVTPALTPTGPYSFSISANDTTNSYQTTTKPSSASNFTFTGMPAGFYTAIISDGLCSFSSTFEIKPLVFDFTVAAQSPTICSGSMTGANITFTNTPSTSQYTYSWNPTIFLSGNKGTFPSTIISPTTALGTQTTLVYTVVVTPSVINCPLTKTLSISVANYITPTVSTIPVTCANKLPFLVQTNPSGGTFYSSPNVFVGSMFVPSLALTGTNSYTYTLGSGNCTKSTTGTFTILSPPLQVSSPKFVCEGDTLTVIASGAQTYSWNNTAAPPVFTTIVNSPVIYTITGADQNGCGRTMTLSVPFKPSPTLSVTGKSQICYGSSSTLTATGANSYTWSTAKTSSQTIVFPTSNTIYTVQGRDSFGCTNKFFFPITIIPTPTLVVSGEKNLCLGQTTTLTVSGADQYMWLNNNFKGTSQIIQPIMNYSFYIVGSISHICSSNTVITLTVMDCTSLEETSPHEMISVFPNPTSGMVTIKCDKPANIIITDGVGRIVLNKMIDPENSEIDLTEFETGIYHFRARSGHETINRKLILKR